MSKPSVSVLALAVTLASATISLAVQITEYPLSATSGPLSIVAGPDGALWFTEYDAGKIGRITTTGAVTEFPLAEFVLPGSIVVGSDGALWFTEPSVGKIGRITTSGAITEFPVGFGAEVLVDLTAGPDGNLWFPYELLVPGPGPLGRIARMTTSGVVTSFDLPSPAHVATAVTAGPDGRIWFAGYGLGTFGGAPFGVIGSLSTSGDDGRATPMQAGIPRHLVAGPDGNLWVTVSFSLTVTSDPSKPVVGEVAKVRTDGTVIDEFRLPSGRGAPDQIAPGPDGNLWFTIVAGISPRIGRITPSGAITEFVLASDAAATDLVAGPDAAVWMTELAGERGGRIARISLLDAICTPSTTALCLDNGRFRVEATWTKSDGGNGVATPVPLGSSSTAGYLWFFTPETPEVTVKVIEGCAFNAHVWFFAGGLTNLGVTLTVTDMAAPFGPVAKTYTNAAGTAFAPIQDTAAFPCSLAPPGPL